MAIDINVDDLEKCFEEFSYYYLHNYEDLAPVIHAHWIEQYDAGGKFYMCSNCVQSNGRPYYKYCPDCGAKMGEEVL